MGGAPFLACLALLAGASGSRGPLTAVRLSRTPRALARARADGPDAHVPGVGGSTEASGAADEAARIERDVYLHPEDVAYREGSRPASAWTLGVANFRRCARSSPSPPARGHVT